MSERATRYTRDKALTSTDQTEDQHSLLVAVVEDLSLDNSVLVCITGKMGTRESAMVIRERNVERGQASGGQRRLGPIELSRSSQSPTQPCL